MHRAGARRRREAEIAGRNGAAAAAGVCVIDIGSGSGLLAMMAARAGAGTVHAVEQSPLLSQVGPTIVANNGFSVRRADDAAGGAAQVVWHQAMSTSVGLSALGGERCDVLVSETLGVSVVDEGGLKFMGDARDRLLIAGAAVPKPWPPGQPQATTIHSNTAAAAFFGEVVPAAVVTWAAVVRCEQLWSLTHATTAAGFDVGSGLNQFRDSKSRLRRMSKDWGFMLSEAPHEVRGHAEPCPVDLLRTRARLTSGGGTGLALAWSVLAACA